jgi:membrane protease YdiL (CAAX protease family)
MVTMPMPESAATTTPMSRWRQVLWPIAAGGAILLLATAAGMAAGAVFDRWSGGLGPRAYVPGEAEALTTSRLALFLIVFQIVVTSLSFVAAPYFAQPGDSVLGFRRPKGGAPVVIAAAVGLFVLVGTYGGLVYTLDRNAFTSDFVPLAGLMRTSMWWLFLLAAGIGAPVAEEILFRGFLFGLLRRSLLGGIGAALVSSLIWAAMHVNYSAYGLGGIVLIGLYLSWLRQRTESLIAPMICHGIYNSLIILTLVFAPEGVPQP